MPSVRVNGTELHYEETGSGAETIVFSHGFLWSLRMYDGQVAALSARYRCVAYDHRGQGRSATSPRPYDMEEVAEDAAALIEKLGCERCHFVGLSMGGFVGLRLALRRAELLRSLVIIDSAADAEPRWNIPKYRLMRLVAQLVGPKPLTAPTMKIMFGRAFLSDPARAAERRALAAHLEGLDPARRTTALEAIIRRRPVEDELGRIRTPTLVLVGADDAAVVPARARRTASRIRGARYVEIPRAGHSSTIEEPAAVTAALEAFFTSLRAGTA